MLQQNLGFPGSSVVKNPPASAGDTEDLGSVPGSGSAPGEGNGNPFHYSCLENPMDKGTWQTVIHRVTQSQTQLNTHTHTHTHRAEFNPNRGGKKQVLFVHVIQGLFYYQKESNSVLSPSQYLHWSQPIDSRAHTQKCLRHCLGCTVPTKLHRHYHTGASVVAESGLVFLIIMTSGHTSVKSHQGTWKNNIKYSYPGGYGAYWKAIQYGHRYIRERTSCSALIRV